MDTTELILYILTGVLLGLPVVIILVCVICRIRRFVYLYHIDILTDDVKNHGVALRI